MTKIITPRSMLVEKVAGALAAETYEAGRSLGMTSKHKNARAYARANIEKFVPNAVEILIEMLKPTSNCSPEMREEIWEALQERINDPELCKVMPNIDVKKVIELADLEAKKKARPIDLVLDKALEPPKAVRH